MSSTGGPWCAARSASPCLAQVYRLGLLEDFDHMYRASALMDRVQGKDANDILQSYTDVLPGRPTSVEHRAPVDDLRKPCDRSAADPLTKLNALTTMAGENPTRDDHMTVVPTFADPVARQLALRLGGRGLPLDPRDRARGTPVAQETPMKDRTEGRAAPENRTGIARAAGAEDMIEASLRATPTRGDERPLARMESAYAEEAGGLASRPVNGEPASKAMEALLDRVRPRGPLRLLLARPGGGGASPRRPAEQGRGPRARRRSLTSEDVPGAP